MAHGATIPVQLRNRREAALRLPPMACAHRDPLDCLAAGPSPVELVSYCCAALSIEQAAALAAMSRYCSSTESCARLPAS